MDADLTCPSSRCKGEGDWRCRDCGGMGRRLPTLAEWDALRAERDRLRDFATWLVEMDDPANVAGVSNRQRVTLTIEDDAEPPFAHGVPLASRDAWCTHPVTRPSTPPPTAAGAVTPPRPPTTWACASRARRA